MPVEEEGIITYTLEDLEADESPDVIEFEPEEFVGVRTRIDRVEVRNGDFGPYLYVATEPLPEIGVRATRLFNLKEKDGKIVWSKRGHLQAYLNRLGVSHPKDLVGKEVIVQVEVKGDRKYLTFV